MHRTFDVLTAAILFALLPIAIADVAFFNDEIDDQLRDVINTGGEQSFSVEPKVYHISDERVEKVIEQKVPINSGNVPQFVTEPHDEKIDDNTEIVNIEGTKDTESIDNEAKSVIPNDTAVAMEVSEEPFVKIYVKPLCGNNC